MCNYERASRSGESRDKRDTLVMVWQVFTGMWIGRWNNVSLYIVGCHLTTDFSQFFGISQHSIYYQFFYYKAMQINQQKVAIIVLNNPGIKFLDL